MHFCRMRTGRLLTVCRSLLPGGVHGPGGVLSPGGVPDPRGVSGWGVYLVPGGVPDPGGCLVQGRVCSRGWVWYPSMH